MKIEHQIQPTWNSCVSTCVAMLMGVPAEEIIEELHDDYMKDKTSLIHYLEGNAFQIEVCNGYEIATWGYVYLITVPSLNTDAMTHCVIMDCREEGNIVLYDPAKGREGKRHYVCPPDGDSDVELTEEGAVKIECFSVDIRIKAFPDEENNFDNNAVAEAMKTIKQALHDDDGYTISWHSNLAMNFLDAMMENSEECNRSVALWQSMFRDTASDAAQKVMQQFFDIDSKKAFPEEKQSED